MIGPFPFLDSVQFDVHRKLFSVHFCLKEFPASEVLVFHPYWVANCLRGAFPTVDFKSACLVLVSVLMLDAIIVIIVQKKFRLQN